MQHPPRKPTDMSVATIPAPPYSNPAILPLISVKALSTTRPQAAALAADQARAIIRYVDGNQRATKTPISQRVLVQEVQAPQAALATLVGKRGKTLPIIIFLAVMIATTGLAFVLENLRPGIRAVDGVAAESLPEEHQTRRPA